MPAAIKGYPCPKVNLAPDVESNVNFYNSKEIMVVPLLSGSGMRIKILEGMAMGKAIISTSIGAEGIPVTPGENILIADTPEEFAKAIKEVFANRDLKQKLEKNARIFVAEQLNNKKLVGDVLNFYQSLMN